MLVPKNAYLPPALMLLAVFAGLSVFGFAGIIFGPVVMIMIVTTINLYRAVSKGGDWRDAFEDLDGDAEKKKKPGIFQRLKAKLGGHKEAKTLAVGSTSGSEAAAAE